MSHDAYRKKVQATLDEWSARMDMMKAKADGLAADARIEYDKGLRELADKQDRLKAKLAEVGDMTEEKWETVKDSMESTWVDAQGAWNHFIDKFKT